MTLVLKECKQFHNSILLLFCQIQQFLLFLFVPVKRKVRAHVLLEGVKCNFLYAFLELQA